MKIIGVQNDVVYFCEEKKDVKKFGMVDKEVKGKIDV